MIQITETTGHQEVFDYIVAFLLKQGARSVGGDGACRYRGDDGTMCAIGCLLPDETYDPWMEGLGLADFLLPWRQERHPDPDRFKPFSKEQKEFFALLIPHYDLLSDLQVSHDLQLDTSEEIRASWIEEFKEIAKDHNLVFDTSKEPYANYVEHPTD